MRFEVEVISEEILPAIRSMMATRLSDDYGLNQEEIADKLGLTQPAVSQYLSTSRANRDIVRKLENDMQVDVLIDDATEKAANDKDYSKEVSQLLTTTRDKGLLKERFQDTGDIM